MQRNLMKCARALCFHAGMNGRAAIGGDIDRAVGFDIEGRRAEERVVLGTGAQTPRQFEVIADVEQLEHFLVAAGELKNVWVRDAMMRQPSSSVCEIRPEKDWPTSR